MLSEEQQKTYRYSEYFTGGSEHITPTPTATVVHHTSQSYSSMTDNVPAKNGQAYDYRDGF
jgi:hypothetical protein